MRDLIRDFKRFIFRGNLIDLAVAVVVGTAFTAVVLALVKDIITPLIATIWGQHSFNSMTFTLHNSVFAYGAFLNALLYFVLVAATVYFLVVAPSTRLIDLARHRTHDPVDKTCPDCQSTVPITATRCMYCTSYFVHEIPDSQVHIEGNSSGHKQGDPV